MYYSTDNPDHGMQYDPFKALVVPRPIGWISTLSESGTPNLAPFSFFNGLSDRPPMLAASIANGKDTLQNVIATGECTVCVATHALVDAMNMSSAAVDSSVSEFSIAKLDTVASNHVKPPRVAQSPAAFECRLWQSVELPVDPDSGAGYTTIILKVLGIYIDDAYITEGRVDTAKMQPLSRLGYMDYAIINKDNMLTLNRPAVADDGKTVTLDTSPWDGKYK